MELLYADQFSADYYEDGIALFTIRDADQFLLLPEGVSAPDGLPSITVLHKPVKNIYLVATSAMDDFIPPGCPGFHCTFQDKGDRMVPSGGENCDGRKIAYAGSTATRITKRS